MKTAFTDDFLRQLLRRSWTVPLRPNAGFRGAVWARIEARRRQPLTWGGWLRLNFGRVAAWATVSIVLAAASGSLLGLKQTGYEREKSMHRYLASIDPGYEVDARSSP